MEYQRIIVQRILKSLQCYPLRLIKRNQGNILAELLFFLHSVTVLQNRNSIMPVNHLCLHAFAEGVHQLPDVSQHMIQPGSGSPYY